MFEDRFSQIPSVKISLVMFLAAQERWHRFMPLSESSESTPVFGLSLWKIKKTFLFFSLEFKLELELELGWKLEWLEGVSKTLGRLVYFVPYLYRGRSPLYNYNTKYTSLPRVSDTPSSHSNFHPNSNSNSNSKLNFRKPRYPCP